MTHAQDTSKEIAFFNRFAEKSDYDSLTPYGYASIICAFHNYLNGRLSNIRRAVDLGCGSGSFTRRFLGGGNKFVVGVDIALEAVIRAKNKKDGIVYFVSDISRLGIKDESVDLVIFSGVLHHFSQSEPSLREAYRILKKGGIVLTYDPHIKHPGMWLYRHPASPFCSTAGRTDNERLLGAPEMQESFKNAGFSAIETTAISGVTISYLESRRASVFLPLYNAAEFLLGLTPFSKSHGSFLICGATKE